MPITNAAPPPVKSSVKPSAKSVGNIGLTSAREEALNGIGQIAQATLIATKQYADAGALGLHWENVSHELALLASKQEAVAKIIDPLLQAGPYAALIAAGLPLIMQVAVNHGVGSAGMAGTTSPELLESQIKTKIAVLELEALRARKEAEQEAQAIRRELEAVQGAEE